MPGETFPSFSQEAVEEELDELSARFQHSLESKYQDECHCLRADTFAKLSKFEADENGITWAVYYLEEPLDNESSVVATDDGVQVIVFTQSAGYDLDEGVPATEVRIITNELVRPDVLGEAVEEYLTYDITIRADNKVSYFVDAISDKELMPDDEDSSTSDEDKILDRKPSSAPAFFITVSGKLFFSDNVMEDDRIAATPMPDLAYGKAVNPNSTRLTPFGNFSTFEDKAHALSVASKIFSRIRNLEPRRHS